MSRTFGIMSLVAGLGLAYAIIVLDDVMLGLLLLAVQKGTAIAAVYWHETVKTTTKNGE